MTGKEVVSFFAKYGYESLYFLPALCILFFLIFRRMLCGGKVIEERLNGETLSIILFFLNLVIAFGMFSALRALFFDFLPSITALIAFLLLILVSVIVCLGGVKKLIKTNLFLFPFIILCIITLLGFGMFMESSEGFFFDVNIQNLPLFSALYVAFNLAHGSVVVSKAGDGLSEKSVTILSAVASIILCLTIGFSILVICNNASEILLEEMPLFVLAAKIGLPMQIMLFVSIVFSGGTTLFAALVTLKDTMQVHTKKSNAFSCFVVCTVALLFSFISFGRIIEIFYPIAGIVGLYLILNLFIRPKVLRGNP